MKKNLSKNGLRDALSTKDTSMSPLILPKDKPIINKNSKYRINDIVVFKKDEKLIAHRVIHILPNNNFLITKGDNNLRSDGKISKNQILGKVGAIQRGKENIKLSHFYLAQSSAYLGELESVVKALARHNLNHIILKGLPLHLFFENHPPKRLYFDVDILVKENDFTKTKQLLKKLGFQEIKSTLFGKNISSATQVSFSKPAKDFFVVIDLHKEPAIGLTKVTKANKLLPISTLTDYLFKHKREIKINNNPYQILNNEALVIYLLIHFFHHNFKGVHRMIFVDSLIRNNKIDWEKVEKAVDFLCLENIVYPGLLFLQKYYQTPLPKQFLEAGKPSLIAKLFSKIIVLKTSPFNSSEREIEGANRFIYLLFFSSANLLKKLRVVFSKETLAYFLLTISSLFSRIFRNSS